MADAMAVRVREHICGFTRNQREMTGLHIDMIVIINNNTNTVLGRSTQAYRRPTGELAHIIREQALVEVATHY